MIDETERKLISIVVPAYNEQDCLEELARRLHAIFAQLAHSYDFEVILVENGSTDSTYEKALEIRDADPRFKILQMSRNFRMEGGMIAGLDHATGDAAVIMCADLQDPPELIPEFIGLWEQGYENVYGIVKKREDNNLFRRAAAQTFYWLIDRLSDSPVPRNASDFRIVDRRVYETFNALSERNRMVRSTWGWLGFRSRGVEHDRPPRFGGVSNFNILEGVAYAYRGILASSFKLLRMIPLVGFLLALLSFAAFLYIVIRAVFFGVPFPGFGTIASLVTLLFGLLFLFLGVIAEYVGMTYTETRGRPVYILRGAEGIEQIDVRFHR